ncbi:uncharacterized protein LOC117090953 isoform X2 [Trachypithecus francoisi]|nr:uncharacterized protein LOC117090953 isoform X2 [Trachypithecus francoisi]
MSVILTCHAAKLTNQVPNARRTHLGRMWKHEEDSRLHHSLLPGFDSRTPFPVARHSYPGMKALIERLVQQYSFNRATCSGHMNAALLQDASTRGSACLCLWGESFLRIIWRKIRVCREAGSSSEQKSRSQSDFLEETHGGPPGSPNSHLSHLEEIGIDLKLVPSEKVCREPEPARVVKDAFGLWSGEEVIHDDLLFQGVRETQWRCRLGSQGPAGLDCFPEREEGRKIKEPVGADE